MDAITDLGVCFRFGQGVQRDILQAAELFMQAAEESGDVVAMGNLSDLKDELQLMAEQGNAMAAAYVAHTEKYVSVISHV
ncbi:hypothetical protein [Collimonas sp.]|uniref:hypothetical protein n=1 Tax=Collimonas sp. TaxID=1963772 RepID=UPI002CA6A1F4|nr:hypothetical protein [Collimonas sp.]HWW08140.1 hypothetical protein [Collimonas sp.]